MDDFIEYLQMEDEEFKYRLSQAIDLMLYHDYSHGCALLLVGLATRKENRVTPHPRIENDKEISDMLWDLYKMGCAYHNMVSKFYDKVRDIENKVFEGGLRNGMGEIYTPQHSWLFPDRMEGGVKNAISKVVFTRGCPVVRWNKKLYMDRDWMNLSEN